MEKILLLTDFYLPHASANGICINKIAKEYIKMGYDVSILGYGIGEEVNDKIQDGIKIYHVKAPLFFKIREKSGKKILWNLMRFFHRTRIALHAFWYPLIYPFFALEYRKMVKKIIEKDNITKVVAEYIPIEAVWSVISLKKRYRNLTISVYVVDTFTQGINEINHPFFAWTSSVWEKKALESCDNFFCMPNFKTYYEKKQFVKYKNKIKFIGLPLIQNNCVEGIYENGNIKLMYTGSWGGDRDPRRIMESIETLNRRGNNIRFIYCGKTNELAKELSHKYDFFEDKGFLSECEMKKIASRVNYLINIGNSTNMLPSKLFSYMSFGVPIMHFYVSETDPCIEYINKYRYSLCFNLNDFSVDEFERKMLLYVQKRLAFEEIEDNYIEFTSKYIANELLSNSKN